MTDDEEDAGEGDGICPAFHPTTGRPQALAARCTSCVFRPGNRMRLAPGRLGDIVARNRAAGAVLVCHQTLPYGDHPEVGPSACRGFLDAYGHELAGARIVEPLFGGWHPIDPPASGDRRHLDTR